MSIPPTGPGYQPDPGALLAREAQRLQDAAQHQVDHHVAQRRRRGPSERASSARRRHPLLRFSVFVTVIAAVAVLVAAVVNGIQV
jgi:hypothetical protein